MTLIIADQHGLYADKRAIKYHNSIRLPYDNINKITVNKQSTAAIGICGNIPVNDLFITAIFSNILLLSFIHYIFAERHWSIKGRRIQGPLHDLWSDTQEVIGDFLARSARTAEISNFVAITKTSTLTLGNNNGDVVERHAPEQFIASGSGEDFAHVYHRAGLDVGSIYKHTTVYDDHVGRGDLNVVQRADLQNINSVNHGYLLLKCLDAPSAAVCCYLLTADHMGGLLEGYAAKHKRPITDAAFVKFWNQCTAYHQCLTEKGEAVVKMIKELKL